MRGMSMQKLSTTSIVEQNRTTPKADAILVHIAVDPASRETSVSKNGFQEALQILFVWE
jgi:hypothetical protein